ncbi:MAG TPA: acyl carrier protein [Caulobacteraceae bacterium]|jgi:acyl carrier protein|nr:acyl carrier protein [Caulobacteraceae bacterium]
MATTTLEQVQSIMQDVFDLDDLEVTPEMSAADIEEWDSLSHIRLIVAVEKAFKIRFKTSEITGLQNIGELVRVIDQKTH